MEAIEQQESVVQGKSRAEISFFGLLDPKWSWFNKGQKMKNSSQDHDKYRKKVTASSHVKTPAHGKPNC